MNKTAVIIIFYNADITEQHLSIAVQDKTELILVDNTPNRDLKICRDNVHYIPLLKNLGIATAQNIGIRKAQECNCTHICFFDQDSNIQEDYIRSMYDEYIKFSKIYNNLFLLGPTVINEKDNREYKSVINRNTTDSIGFQRRREIISSGSFTSTETIEKIGLLDDSLFIDAVDFEWCWRGNKLGYICGITRNVHLDHNVGRRVIYIGNYMIIISAPFRYFYQFRNYIILCKRKYVPIKWKINTGIKYLLRLIYFPFVLKDGITITKFMYKGIFAGLKNEKL